MSNAVTRKRRTRGKLGIYETLTCCTYKVLFCFFHVDFCKIPPTLEMIEDSSYLLERWLPQYPYTTRGHVYERSHLLQPRCHFERTRSRITRGSRSIGLVTPFVNIKQIKESFCWNIQLSIYYHADS